MTSLLIYILFKKQKLLKRKKREMPNDNVFPMWHQDWQSIKAGEGCECERAACTSQTPLEMYSGDSQAPRFICWQTPEVCIYSGFY